MQRCKAELNAHHPELCTCVPVCGYVCTHMCCEKTEQITSVSNTWFSYIMGILFQVSPAWKFNLHPQEMATVGQWIPDVSLGCLPLYS